MRPRPTTILLLAVLILASPPLHSQEPEVTAGLAGQVLWSRVADSGTVLVGGEAWLDVRDGLRIGGFGYGMVESVRLSGGALRRDLSLGYGGIFAGLDLVETRAVGLDARLLLGAGNAQVHARPIGNQLGSDNFLILEPRLGLEFPPSSRLRGALRIGYRFVTGVQDLPGVGPGDLQSWNLIAEILLGEIR